MEEYGSGFPPSPSSDSPAESPTSPRASGNPGAASASAGGVSLYLHPAVAADASARATDSMNNNKDAR